MEVKIESLETYNMSNWEATHTFDTLNTANNKNNILKYISEYLNDGGQKNAIFIFSSSFKINSNYSRYFNNGNELSLNILDDLQNIFYMGKIIPFEYNEELANIQYIFDEYKSLNYIVADFANSSNRRNKFVSTDLIKYLKMIPEHDIHEILKEMFTFYNEKLKQIYTKQKDANEELYIKTINKLSQKHNNVENRYAKFINNYKVNTNNKFMDNFYSFSRPIIGIYDKETRTIEIINSDQMYEKGKHCKDELGLISITRNSPIKITVNSVGIMENIFNYLLLSEHTNKSFIDNNTYRNDDELIKKIFNSNDLNINVLASKVLKKIEEVTNDTIVSLQEIIKNN